MTQVRVVSWNVRSLRDGRGRVVAVLRGLRPDVVVLQEAPRLVLWRLSRWWLARACGLRVATHGWGAGNVVLVAPDVHVERSAELRLPRRPGLHRRAAALALLSVRGQALTVVGTHLDLDPAARLDSARRVRSFAGDGPLLLVADANEEPGQPGWAALGQGLVDVRQGLGPTFPATAPRRSIDGAWASSGLGVSTELVDVAGASDHLAVLLLVE